MSDPPHSREHDGEFTRWVGARQGGLLRTAYLLTGDHHQAQDLVQVVLAKAYLAWPRIAAADSPEAYARRMLVNQHTSWWRRAWRSREVSVAEVRDGIASGRSAPPADADLPDEALWAALRRLSPRQRSAVVLRFVEDRSEAEVAALMGCSVGAVKSHTSRALAALRVQLVEPPAATEGHCCAPAEPPEPQGVVR